MKNAGISCADLLTTSIIQMSQNSMGDIHGIYKPNSLMHVVDSYETFNTYCQVISYEFIQNFVTKYWQLIVLLPWKQCICIILISFSAIGSIYDFFNVCNTDEN
jgi:hypothetical protein